MEEYFVHPTSVIEENVHIGKDTKIWLYCHVQPGAVIGERCSLGQNVNVSNNVTIGNDVRIQNNVSIYEGVEIEDKVFCGPSCVFTNDIFPRAYPIKKTEEYLSRTIVKEGAAIGANATIVCGNEIGRWSMIAAGAVVTTNVPSYALMVGVPAKQIGWVCKCGNRLDNNLVCAKCCRKYKKLENGIELYEDL